jgi:bacterioferritin-associated ferredoxin
MAVTDTEVRVAIEGGAITREAVTAACRAGGDCGSCRGMIETMIEDHLEDAATRAYPPAPASAEQLIPEAALAAPRAVGPAPALTAPEQPGVASMR